MASSGDGASTKELLLRACSVLKACQNTTMRHPPKMGVKHKKMIKTVSKEIKGAKTGKLISTKKPSLTWTDDDDEENIENIPVRQRNSERPSVMPSFKMISFSSDSDSSPDRRRHLPGSRSQQRPIKGKVTNERMKCREGKRKPSVRCSSLVNNTERETKRNYVNGTTGKVKGDSAESVKEKGTRRKGKGEKQPKGTQDGENGATRVPSRGIRTHHKDLDGLFDISSGGDSASEPETTGVSVLRSVNGDVSCSDGEDISKLSLQLSHILSLKSSRGIPKKLPKKSKNDGVLIKTTASAVITAGNGLGSVQSEHPLLKPPKRKIVGKNAKKSVESRDSTSDRLRVDVVKTQSPCVSDNSSRTEVSVSSANEDLPELKEIGLQVSLGTTPEVSFDDETCKTLGEFLGKRDDSENFSSETGRAISKVSVGSSGDTKELEDSSCSGGATVEDSSRNDSVVSAPNEQCEVSTRSIETDLNEQCEVSTRNVSLQVSLGSTQYSSSDSSRDDISLHDTDLSAVQNSSLQVSLSATNVSLVSSEGMESEHVVVSDDDQCVPSSSENPLSCETNSCDDGIVLAKQLFPKPSPVSPAHNANRLPPTRDSGFVETSHVASFKRPETRHLTNGNRPPSASCADLSVDSQSATSSSPEDSSPVNSVGSSEASKDSDEWLPDLDSSSGDSDLESFLQVIKTPKTAARDLPSMDEFIVNDSDVSSDEDDNVLYVTAIDSPPKNRSPEDNSLDSVFVTPCLPPVRRKGATTLKKPVSSRHRGLGVDVPLVRNTGLPGRVKPIERSHSTGDLVGQASFLRSLDQHMEKGHRDLQADRFVRQFKKLKEELTAHLFKLYNDTVFGRKLPEDMSVTWNKRLNKTAGFCAYSKRATDRKVRIELSVKVCDTAERVRDTLIHELCHAAVWLLNGVNDGHGPHWKYWARAACFAHPELPAINRCHKYKITHKYIYKCTKCGYEIGRHSKSLDTKAKVCGYCRSPFALHTKSAGTPRTPNKFALFVKENYGSVKRGNKAVTHKDVMTILSSDFARQNSI